MMHRLLAAAAVAGTLLVAVQPAQAQLQYIKQCPDKPGWMLMSSTPLECVDLLNGGNEGTAISLSLPEAVVEPGKTFGLGAKVGVYGGSTALGVAAAVRAGDGLTVNGAVGVGTGEGHVGGSLGLNFSW